MVIDFDVLLLGAPIGWMREFILMVFWSSSGGNIRINSNVNNLSNWTHLWFYDRRLELVIVQERVSSCLPSYPKKSVQVYYLAYSSHSTGYSVNSFCDWYLLIFLQTSRFSLFPTFPTHAQFHPRHGLSLILYLGVWMWASRTFPPRLARRL